jgi:hypothetical protein
MGSSPEGSRLKLAVVRRGFTSKVHCLGDARGRPIAFDLTPDEGADCKSYDTLIELPERAPGAHQDDLLQQAALPSA